MPTGANRWQFSISPTVSYTGPAPSGSNWATAVWTVGTGYPTYPNHVIYINCADKNNNVKPSDNPTVTASLSVQFPRDPTTYRVDVGLNKQPTGLDTPIYLSTPYVPTLNDQIVITFLSLNNNPYTKGLYPTRAGGVNLGNFTGLYPYGLYLLN